MKHTIKFAEHVGLAGRVVTAYTEDAELNKKIIGKHYLESGLSWNIIDPVRDTQTLEGWKEKLYKDLEVE